MKCNTRHQNRSTQYTTTISSQLSTTEEANRQRRHDLTHTRDSSDCSRPSLPCAPRPPSRGSVWNCMTIVRQGTLEIRRLPCKSARLNTSPPGPLSNARLMAGTWYHDSETQPGPAKPEQVTPSQCCTEEEEGNGQCLCHSLLHHKYPPPPPRLPSLSLQNVISSRV